MPDHARPRAAAFGRVFKSPSGGARPARPLRRGLRRHAIALAAAWALLGFGLAGAQPPATADVVVDFGTGGVLVGRASLGASLTGLDALERIGVPVAAASGAVCAIDGVGCPAADCFCACRDPESDCRYWRYHHGTGDDGWVAATEGPAQYSLVPGAVDGWAWSDGRPPAAMTAEARSVAVGFGWLRGQQLPDGSLGGHAGMTAEAVFAARAAGVNLAAWRTGGRSTIDFLRAQADAYSAGGPAAAGKLTAAVVAAGSDPRAFGGVDLVARVEAAHDPATDQYGTSSWDQAWAMIGLAAAGVPVPPAAVDRLAAQRSAGGGWGFAPLADEPDADSTGLALMALGATALPVTEPDVATAIEGGLASLKTAQRGDGGFVHEPAGASNVNATAYALSGLLALGEDPRGMRWAVAEDADPVAFLLAAQRPEGRFGFDSAPADLVATLQVLPALAGRHLPMSGSGAAAGRAATWILEQRTAEGAFDGFQPGATADAVLALAALGRDPTVPAPSGRTAADFLADQATVYASTGPEATGKLIAAAVALGADPRAFGGLDLLSALGAYYDRPTGRYFPPGAWGPWSNAWPILGLAAAGEDVPPAAIQALIDGAATGGGWGFEDSADAPTVDSTAIALQALAAAGVPADHVAVRAAVDALHALQAPGGGYTGFGGTISTASTASAAVGLVAAGQEVGGPGWMRGGAAPLARPGPLEVVLAAQSPAGGFAGYTGANDPAATYAAALALTRRPLPVRAVSPVVLPFLARGF